MNDLDLLEGFRADLPPADPAMLSRARARMFQEPAPRNSARWAWRLVPAGALAAAVVAAVAFGGAALRPPSPAPNRAAPDAAAPSTASILPTNAPNVLRLAAAEVRDKPPLPARPGQFVYVESLVAYDNVASLEKHPTWVPPKEVNRKIWLAVDGVQPGLLREKAVKTGQGSGDVPLDANVPPAYVTNLPTNPKAMRAWLYQDGNRNPRDAEAWVKVGDTLREQYVTPAEQSAMFEAAATIPGTTLIKQADLAGRKGVAVTRLNGQVRFDYIFDPVTYQFMGERVVVVGHLPPYPKGAVSAFTAQLRVAIVDKAGQLP
jgi:hypothetical protein